MKPGISGFSGLLGLWLICLGLAFCPPPASATTLDIGSGNQTSHLVVEFTSGERLWFRVNRSAASILAPDLVAAVIQATGGELLVTPGYTSSFSSALETLANPGNPGLVVQYQNSADVPFINGIRWNGPTGPSEGDYLGANDWWQIWVLGPAHLEQPWNSPPTPIDLLENDGWFRPEASGLADITLQDGAWLGLVYGSALAPAIPEPSVASLFLTIAFFLKYRKRRHP